MRRAAPHERREPELPIDVGADCFATPQRRTARDPQLPHDVVAEHRQDLLDIRVASRAVAPRIHEFPDDRFLGSSHGLTVCQTDVSGPNGPSALGIRVHIGAPNVHRDQHDSAHTSGTYAWTPGLR